MSAFGRIGFAVAGAVAVAGAQTTAVSGEPLKVAQQAELEWELTKEGVAFARLEGDRFKESYMAMVRLPGGLSSPLHTKSAGMYGIVISGEMTHVDANGDPAAAPILNVGDFYRIPAGLPHVSKCVSDEPCLTFLYQDGPFDFLPVQGSKQ